MSPYWDMWLALRTFRVTRDSESCFTIYDFYDFRPDALKQALQHAGWPLVASRSGGSLKLITDVVYLPQWAYQLSGAREFKVLGGGKL